MLSSRTKTLTVSPQQPGPNKLPQHLVLFLSGFFSMFFSAAKHPNLQVDREIQDLQDVWVVHLRTLELTVSGAWALSSFAVRWFQKDSFGDTPSAQLIKTYQNHFSLELLLTSSTLGSFYIQPQFPKAGAAILPTKVLRGHRQFFWGPQVGPCHDPNLSPK